MKKNLVFSLILLPLISFCQTDTTENITYPKLVEVFFDNGQLKERYHINEKDRKLGMYQEWFDDGVLREKGNYNKEGKQHGEWLEYYSNKQLKSSVTYAYGIIDGKVITYWSNGKLKREDLFLSGNFHEGKCFDEEGNEIEHFDYQIMPSYPKNGIQGLMTYLSENIQYPKKAKRNGITGKIFVNFTVSKTGTIENVKILRGVHSLLDEEAKRVVEAMPNWIPGEQDGEKVSVSFNLPINFALKNR